MASIRLFIFGLGYSASCVRAAALACGMEVRATGRAGDIAFEDEAAVGEALTWATHVLSSVPPAASGVVTTAGEAAPVNSGKALDPVLARYGAALAGKRLLYLSSTGVYGDAGGAWVDESAPVVGLGGSGRRTARSLCDAAWLALDALVLRLPGIYGPGRSVLERIRSGRARRIEAPGQVFSRVHVEDIAHGVLAALDGPCGAYNLADDLPASNNAVVEEGCRLLGIVPPPRVSLEEAGLSPEARGFYAENRRVANGKAKRVLGWRPLHPTYRQGLAACLAAVPAHSTR